MRIQQDDRTGLWTLLYFAAVVAVSVPGLAADEGGQAASSDATTVSESEARSDEDGEQADGEASEVVFDRMLVTGGAEEARRTPGSAHFIGIDQLDEKQYDDAHRILRQVPGLNIQEEEGYGLRPNIGMRGTGTERSSRITLMEDGVLVAPAPYTAPSAYYFPTAGRMAAFEVMKGPAAIRQGPFTTGGVLNMVSTDFPFDLGGRVDLAVGNDETGKLRAIVGNTGERLAWMLETYQFETDGFKDLDGGGSTGYELSDYLGKVRWTSSPDAEVYQSLELKLGHTEQFGNETYLGLTDDDFAATPYRRYAASQEDWIDTDHDQYQLRYIVNPTSNFDLTATVYRNEFFRNWHKLQSVAGSGLSGIFEDPGANDRELAIIRGEIDSEAGELKIRNNRREYYGQGVQTIAGWRLGHGDVEHGLEIGLRYHEDEEDRFQEEDAWQMVDGFMTLNGLGDPGSQSNRVASADAVAFWVLDRIDVGRWSVRPGVRFETIDYVRRDYGKEDPDRDGVDLSVRENQVDAWIPGVGVDYWIDESWGVFGGLHKGFAPPGAGASEDADPEESLNYEAGFRFGSGPASAEVIAFFNDYTNLLGADTLSSGGDGSGDLHNGGDVDVWGLEATWGSDLGSTFGSTYGIPVQLTYTYTKGEFQTSFESDYDPWGDVEAGDELPYLPEHQLFASVGLSRERWATYFSGSFVTEMRTTAGQGSIPANERTDDVLTFDLGGNVRLVGNLRLDVQIRNIFDEAAVVSRRPSGVRPNLSRTALVGINWEF